MPSPESIIIRLRPASGKAVDIASALSLAATAAADQDAAVAAAKQARDDALLDAEPATLRKAEQVLADAREQGERISAVQANLQARHTAAVEAELLADFEALKQKQAANYEAMNGWWLKERAELLRRLPKGFALSEAVSTTTYELQALERCVRDRYPAKQITSFQPPAMQSSDWPRELGRRLDFLYDQPKDLTGPSGLATLCDPVPPGSF